MVEKFLVFDKVFSFGCLQLEGRFTGDVKDSVCRKDRRTGEADEAPATQCVVVGGS